MKKASIAYAASQFRHAIESLDEVNLGVLKYFPEGCCGNTALMLGAYLHECKLGDFRYVSGERGSLSHAWLEKNGMIVDITGDQFENGAAVYVGRRNAFYRKFRIHSKDLWNKSLDGDTIESDRLYPLYSLILNRIRDSLPE